MDAEHVTIDEIDGQPDALDAVIDELAAIETDVAAVLDDASTICLVGCGTSYFLAQSGAALLNASTASFAIPGSEAFVSPETIPSVPIDVVVPVSRSGESSETVIATEQLAEENPDATVLGITCTAGSAIDELSDVTVLSPAGTEEGVVMTKSFSSMLLALEYLARLAAGERDVAETYATVAADSRRVLEQARPVAEELGSRTDLAKSMFLGTGECYGLAAEAMLKLEEMTLTWTKAYHALEFRHGPRSIVDDETLVAVFLPDRERERHADLVAEANELGAETLVVGRASALEAIGADHAVAIPDDAAPSLSLYAPAFQLLGYHRAVAEGLDPDSPQNLSQVVTL